MSATTRVRSQALARNGDRSAEGQAAVARVERVIVAVRIAIVLSVAVLLVSGVASARQHLDYGITLVCVASVYAAVIMCRPDWERRRTRPAGVVTVIDSVLALIAVAVTGASASPAATILMIVVVAASTRTRVCATVCLALALAAVHMAIVLLVDPELNPLAERVQIGAWWACYLLITAVLGAALSLYAEREHEAGTLARAEAIAEHSAAEEERDLRARLLAAHQAQQDGLRVILHDFRTPMASLRALTTELADPANAMDPAERETGLRLTAAHVEHLAEMLNALSDVAASRNPTFGSGGDVRSVEVRELVLAAGAAAGLRPPDLRVGVSPPHARIRVDVQGLRRVLINLLDNAARHGRDEPVDVVCSVFDSKLSVEILDRGPGLCPEELQRATQKNVSFSDPGGAGLGLWIVEQILQAMDGELELDTRPGGGFVVRLRLPPA